MFLYVTIDDWKGRKRKKMVKEERTDKWLATENTKTQKEMTKPVELGSPVCDEICKNSPNEDN